MLVFAAPNPALDKLFVTDEVQVGRIHRPEALVARAGGKGLNAARAAAALGRPVRAVAVLAGFTGRRLVAMLEEGGIAVDAVRAQGETRSALSVLSRASGALTEFYEAGEPGAAAVWDDFTQALGRRAAAATWVALSGSLPPGVGPADGAELVAGARRAGARVAVDLAGPVLGAALRARPTLVKVNEHEARELTGARRDAALDALAALAPPGCLVVITLGADGALLRTPSGKRWRGRLDERGLYPVGSGDAFLAGLLVALEQAPGDIAAALACALGAGTANALEPGAGSLEAAQARRLAAAAHVERLPDAG